MNVFDLRQQLIDDYAAYTRSFFQIADARIRDHVERALGEGLLWPEPLIQVNPSFAPGDWIDELVAQGVLHPGCSRVFELKPAGRKLRLHRHQADAVRTARSGRNYVLTTGTGSGKSLAYMVPIVDHVLRHGGGRGIQALIVYPMNALANSQYQELEKFLQLGFPDGKGPVRFEKYTGQETDEQRQAIIANPPDILLTNYVMLELLLTRVHERQLIAAARGLRFLVLDELHTYRGRQGSDVAFLVRRAREFFEAPEMQCVGTSATLAGSGTQAERRKEVARVASLIFGSEVLPDAVIGETLRRSTPERDVTDSDFVRHLRDRIADDSRRPPQAYREFVTDPLSSWLETTFGVTRESGTGILVRTAPRTIGGSDGAASDLSRVTGLAEDQCVGAIRGGLLAGYTCEPNPETGFPAFAFRVHQFLSRGDTVYASPEPETTRYITVNGQQFVPGDRERVLLPLVFCRECGQEYYSVLSIKDPTTRVRVFAPRDFGDQNDDAGRPGFIYLSATAPWPDDAGAVVQRLPEDWLEDHGGTVRVRANRRDNLPQAVRIGTDGRESPTGTDCHFAPAPFRFCLRCGVAYGFRQTSDLSKLATLGSGGRASATTVLSLSTIRHIKREATLPAKLLSFTDNRQDASLQAGHFNDFVEIGQLRSALYRACLAAAPEGLTHEVLTQRVFDALGLPFGLYASNPDLKFHAADETRKALRDVLGYRLYRDLERGWRLTSPNLEQCGLLGISYLSLVELCADEESWQKCHAALLKAKAETRARIARTLLDFMRRELAINVEYLDSLKQESIQQASAQRLRAPWAIDEGERLEYARVLYPRSMRPTDQRDDVYLSPRGGFGQYLRKSSTFPDHAHPITVAETGTIVSELLDRLRIAGLVEQVMEPRDETDVPGYQLPASAMRWIAGDGSIAFHDPIRVPNPPPGGGRTNPFFVDFYRAVASTTVGFEAREHTAQVPYADRVAREQRFRAGTLPILYCSPTMELGIDIAELNVVNMRNVPPSPANYAQRSGRAGRSGQPALVFSYCAGGSPHDQYFFKRPALMVAGAVMPPRLDLSNEDLVRAHVHSVWLTETRLSLGSSLRDLLDLGGERPSLSLQPHVRAAIDDPAPRARAKVRTERVLATALSELEEADWYSAGWLDEVLHQVAVSFDAACDRWRSLYRAALGQREIHHRILGDPTRSTDHAQSRRLRAEAEAQLKLLTTTDSGAQSDFYSYRYFASEGFLPGYSFPRLPLSAYIPGRRLTAGRDEFLSRPRFLAIAEFGPRALVYHEGSRYVINKAILPMREEEGEDVLTSQAKHCGQCGYLHQITGGSGPDLCQHCGTLLDPALASLFRMQNVATRRRDRINSDEEERLRRGYEIRTGFRFAEPGGRPSVRTASVTDGDGEVATLEYGPAATLWRINVGWRRRAAANQLGFVLDMERGYWQSDAQAPGDGADDGDPLSQRTRRVIPYVEDRRNSLVLKPAGPVSLVLMASLQSALKAAIQVYFQLEDTELAVDPLPGPDDRRHILLYESAEGGAGVLRQLIDDPKALGALARTALELCHFHPETGEDRRKAPGAREECEAACYACLMSYGNQPDHLQLDRQSVRPLLQRLAGGTVAASPVALPRAEHLAQIRRQCGSDLERSCLDWMDQRDLRLPSRAQFFVEACRTRPDFIYDEHHAAIYVDGPPHEFPERQERDQVQADCMEDHGWTVIRFRSSENWQEVIRRYPSIFGTSR